MSENIECCRHGEQEATYVCQHLARSLETLEQIGFFHSGPVEKRSDAWCSQCEAVRLREGGESGDWNERSEAFAGITLLCGACYDEVKNTQRG